MVGVYSLFPLLHPANLLLVKLTLYLAFVLLQLVAFRSLFNIRLSFLERLYCLGFVPLFLYTEVVHHQIPWMVDRLPFLPLLLTSVYCALGVSYFWLTVTFRFVAVRVGGTAAAAAVTIKTSTTSKTKVAKVAVQSKKEGKTKKEVTAGVKSNNKSVDKVNPKESKKTTANKKKDNKSKKL